jgi:hypothetical protein
MRDILAHVELWSFCPGQLEKAVESLEQQKQEAVDMCFYTMDNIDDGYQRQGKFNDQTMRMLLRRCVQCKRQAGAIHRECGLAMARSRIPLHGFCVIRYHTYKNVL